MIGYDVSAMRTGGAWPYAWWCRGCGEFTPVDDADHCRGCVPPLEEVLRGLIRGHLGAHHVNPEAAPPWDREQLDHLDAAHAALHAVGRLGPVVDDEDDDRLDGLRCPHCRAGAAAS